MGTIKDRAARYARRVTGWLPLEDCRDIMKNYAAGATEQKEIDDARFKGLLEEERKLLMREVRHAPCHRLELIDELLDKLSKEERNE